MHPHNATKDLRTGGKHDGPEPGGSGPFLIGSGGAIPTELAGLQTRPALAFLRRLTSPWLLAGLDSETLRH